MSDPWAEVKVLMIQCRMLGIETQEAGGWAATLDRWQHNGAEPANGARWIRDYFLRDHLTPR